MLQSRQKTDTRKEQNSQTKVEEPHSELNRRVRKHIKDIPFFNENLIKYTVEANMGPKILGRGLNGKVEQLNTLRRDNGTTANYRDQIMIATTDKFQEDLYTYIEKTIRKKSQTYGQMK